MERSHSSSPMSRARRSSSAGSATATPGARRPPRALPRGGRELRRARRRPPRRRVLRRLRGRRRRLHEAVTEAQRAFAAHAWPEGVELRVRMGLHTGEPTFRDGAYFGLDVHRAARIAQAGSGGQVLLSERTRDELDSIARARGSRRARAAGPRTSRSASIQLNVPGLPSRVPAAQHGSEGVSAACA